MNRVMDERLRSQSPVIVYGSFLVSYLYCTGYILYLHYAPSPPSLPHIIFLLLSLLVQYKINEWTPPRNSGGIPPVSKRHQIQPGYRDEQADAGRDCRTRLARPRAGLATLPG